LKPGDLFRTRCDAPPPIVEWAAEVDDAGRPLHRCGHGVTETLPPGVPVLFLRRGFDAWQRRLCVLVGGRAGWVWEYDLEPL
jgi:hypothetical protein